MTRQGMARRLLLALALAAAPSLAHAAPPDPIRIELNAAAAGEADHCRLSFVIENKSETAMTSLKLDLVIFDRNGVIGRRLVTEMGPLHAAKTVVKTFALDGGCADVGGYADVGGWRRGAG